MPELPEVETIKLGLQKKIVSLRIKDIQVLNPKSFQGDKSRVLGAKVVNVFRRAKMLGIELKAIRKRHSGDESSRTPESGSWTSQDDKVGSEITLLFHLKMSGQLILVQSQESRVKSQEKRFVGGHPTQDMLGALPNKSTRVILS